MGGVNSLAQKKRLGTTAISRIPYHTVGDLHINLQIQIYSAHGRDYGQVLLPLVTSQRAHFLGSEFTCILQSRASKRSQGWNL